MFEMTYESLITRCNRMEYPLREFIERTLGPGRLYHRYWIDRAMRWPGPTPEEDALDLFQYGPPPVFREPPSQVFAPADRIAFLHHEGLGASIGHTAGLLRVDFQ